MAGCHDDSHAKGRLSEELGDIFGSRIERTAPGGGKRSPGCRRHTIVGVSRQIAADGILAMNPAEPGSRNHCIQQQLPWLDHGVVGAL
jgi:hypothetical protein